MNHGPKLANQSSWKLRLFDWKLEGSHSEFLVLINIKPAGQGGGGGGGGAVGWGTGSLNVATHCQTTAPVFQGSPPPIFGRLQSTWYWGLGVFQLQYFPFVKI